MSRARKSNWYLSSADIYKEWVKWRDSSPVIESRVISEELGR